MKIQVTIKIFFYLTQVFTRCHAHPQYFWWEPVLAALFILSLKLACTVIGTFFFNKLLLLFPLPTNVSIMCFQG